jgi:hypothetical protein
VLIEFVREPLRPRRQLFSKKGVKHRLKRMLVPNLLVASCLVNEAGDTEMGQPP